MRSLEKKSLLELLIHLYNEHQDNFVYRGQSIYWPGTLFPSFYRTQLSIKPFKGFTEEMRLREIGQSFHAIDIAKARSFLSSRDNVNRIKISNYFRHLFGYPLSQLLGQQYGISSEALDVTTEPEIAAFFSKYDFNSKQFIDESKSHGVIFRFKIKKTNLNTEDMSLINFYDIPAYIDANTILKTVGECSTWEEAKDSFMLYRNKYYEKLVASSNPPVARPLSLLKLPAKIITESRIFKQKAGLLFPDWLLSKNFLKFDFPPPVHKAQKDGLEAIENLHDRNDIEIFLFNHSVKDKEIIRLSCNDLFPVNDGFKRLLYEFMSEGPMGFQTQYEFISRPDTSTINYFEWSPCGTV